jgi:CBS domain-containing protein
MLVSDIMTLDPACCTPDSTAQEAAARMRSWSTGVLPVIEDVETCRIAGVVTDRDLCVKVVAAGRVPAHVLVRECMTTDVVCCAAGEPVERALAAMREHRLRRLPVVDSTGSVVGIISLTDIVRYSAVPQAEAVAAISHIAEPHAVMDDSGQHKAVTATY